MILGELLFCLYCTYGSCAAIFAFLCPLCILFLLSRHPVLLARDDLGQDPAPLPGWAGHLGFGRGWLQDSGRRLSPLRLETDQPAGIETESGRRGTVKSAVSVPCSAEPWRQGAEKPERRAQATSGKRKG